MKSPTYLYRHAWTAYVGAVLRWLFMIAFAIGFYRLQPAAYRAISLGLGGLATTIGFITIFRWRLLMDEKGVWIRRGLIPGRQVVTGFKWDELGEACFTPSLFSQLYRSFKIELRQRGDSSKRLVLDHWYRGDWVVGQINAELVRRRPADNARG